MAEKDTILITAGPVYGRLDDNKIVSNRSRGLWAAQLVPRLLDRGYRVLMAVPDIALEQIRAKIPMDAPVAWQDRLEYLVHDGYDSYADICYDVARDSRTKAAIMAAAVTNYIPKFPVKGKMATTEKEILIPFVLAERVINRMKKMNPTLTLIGCKLLFSGEYATLIDKAYGVVLEAKCNAVIANDGKLGLKRKFIVHQDRAVVEFNNDFGGFYNHLIGVIEDAHYSTKVTHIEAGWDYPDTYSSWKPALSFFDRLADRYRPLFVRRQAGKDFVFGAVAVPVSPEEYLVSPREKGEAFTSSDSAVVLCVLQKSAVIRVWNKHRLDFASPKASLNAPLLIRHLEKYSAVGARGVVHFHDTYKPERSDGLVGPSDVALAAGIDFLCPVVPYAPPGTVRDNNREIPAPVYYIEGHGWIVAVDEKGSPLRKGQNGHAVLYNR